MKRTSFISVVVPLAAMTAFSLPASAQLSVYTVNSLARVKQEAAAVNQPNTKLWAARGEWESFQIVAHAGGQLVSHVNLALTVADASITLYRESYVRIEHPTPTWGGIDYTNKYLDKGYYADALIPFNDPVSGQPLEGAEYDAVPVTVNQTKTLFSGLICKCHGMLRPEFIKAVTP